VAAEHHAFITRTGLSAKPNVVNTLRKADWQRASIMLSNLQQTKEALLRKICFYILEHCAEAPGPLVKSTAGCIFYRKHGVC
jgi:hypothetical protein